MIDFYMSNLKIEKTTHIFLYDFTSHLLFDVGFGMKEIKQKIFCKIFKQSCPNTMMQKVIILVCNMFYLKFAAHSP